MDDLIYTLLVIGWIAYGIFSAVKKNKAKAKNSSATQAPVQDKSTVETVFESLFQENTQTYSEVNSPYYESGVEEENTDSESDYYTDEAEEYEETDYLDTVPEKSTESKIDTYSGTDNIDSSFHSDEEEDEIKQSAITGDGLSGENEDLADFDLRQGIIAQAVLDRPYK